MFKRYRETFKCNDFLKAADASCSFGPYKNIPNIQTTPSTWKDPGLEEISGWFLGTKAENIETFSKLVQEAISALANHRRFFHPEDPSHITEEVKRSSGYLYSIQSLTDKFRRLLAILNEYATPFFSMRYQGHMLWDTTLPALLGYFATMLHNPNNVTIQSSPVTTFLEMMVGEDLCRMIGFDPVEESWAHITCDGTVANLEAMWSARELKLLPLGIKASLEEEFPCDKDIGVRLSDGSEASFSELEDWQLLNLTASETLSLPIKIAEQCGLSPRKVWEALSNRYSVNALGLIEFYRRYLSNINPPVYLVPSTGHYSLSKGSAILGIGTRAQLLAVDVDRDARMDINDLKSKLIHCIEKKIPVVFVTAVIGSTEESAVDPLDEILALRDEMREKYRFDFNVHADAAWGGYHISVIRKNFDIQWFGQENPPDRKDQNRNPYPFIEDISSVLLSEYVIRQLKSVRFCESVTIDPHKCGYIPYPAGSLAYRNKRMINLITFGAPYIGLLEKEKTMGQFGVEGSKPGAAAASVFLSHSVIRPSVHGYGKLLSQSLINTKLFYVNLLLMALDGDPFFVVPLPHLLGEKEGCDESSEVEFIRNCLYEKKIKDIIADDKLRSYFNELGPDQNILNYAFNFYTDDGTENSDMAMVNALNQLIYDRLHLNPGTSIGQYDLFITMTHFYREDYGNTFMNDFAGRLRVAQPDFVEEIRCLRSVVMDPWMAETEVDDTGLNFFQSVIIPKLKEAVIKSVAEIKKNGIPIEESNHVRS